jgi:hypothetical protein
MIYESRELPPAFMLFVSALAYEKGFMQVKVGSFTRDTSLASGTQAITGVGFKPKAVIFFVGMANTAHRFSVGMDDGTTGASVADDNVDAAGSFFPTTGRSIDITGPTSADNYNCVIQSMDADGFTLSWSKIGSPSGTAGAMYLALGG